MQILFEKTYEDGIQNGLSLFRGEIKKLLIHQSNFLI